MTQNATVDLELLMQADSNPSSVVKGATKRGFNYNHQEDIQLCISWMNISNDPVIGNEQPAGTYWERIAQDFHKNKEFQSERTPNSLEHRCGTIIKECMKFQAFFEEVERRHPSGVPYQEHVLIFSLLCTLLVHMLSLLQISHLIFITDVASPSTIC